MVSPRILDGPRLKIERAQRHIDEFRNMTEPLHPSLYEIAVEPYREFAIQAEPRGYQLVYRPKRPIPKILAIIIGDAVHNLRSALDHVAGGMIRTLPDPPKKKPYFPIHPERDQLATDASLAAMDQALPGAKKLLLEELRPAGGPDEITWRFNDLSNLDKHNLIIPAVTFGRAKARKITVGTTTFDSIAAGNDATDEIGLMLAQQPITVDGDFEATVEVWFGEGDHPFVGQSVLPTLIQIAELVSKTVDAFDRLIGEQKAQN